MKINFIGGFLPKDKLSEYVENSSGLVHYAADSLQQSIITGLKANSHLDINLTTVPFLLNFPSYKKIYIKKEKTDEYQIVPFLNLKFIDSFFKSFSLRKIIKKDIKNEANDNVILIYGMLDYFLKSIPNNYENKVCLIVPDLPRMTGGDIRKLKIRIYFWYIDKVINRNLDKVDCFVFISKYMKDHIELKGRPWIVIEGIYNNQKVISAQKKEENITILYTGTLDRRYGILDLLESFSLITEKNYRLWICGEGIGKKDVQESALKDERITYFGQISNEEVQVLQRRASLLVNPRKNDMEYTKFSFPSKTMEYLASGTPVIMHKLGGIPDEYHQYFFCPKDNSPEALKDKIIEVTNMPVLDRNEHARKAQEFIFKYKNPKVQAGKIIELLNRILQ